MFKGRDSTGVRGISLATGDKVIAMAIIRHFDALSEERAAYLKMSRAVRGELESEETAPDDVEEAIAGELSQERYAGMSAAEQFILTVSENGFGKRTSSHEYRTTGRGGKGIVAMAVNDRNGPLIGSFPVEADDQLMLVTNAGQVIRVPVDAGPENRIRIVGRSSQGVTVFKTSGDEKVVSVERISEPEGDGEADVAQPEE
jgi:DNA gyrase subunit A